MLRKKNLSFMIVRMISWYLLLFSSAVWLHSMIAATAIPTLLNSMRPDDDRSDLRGNSLIVVGASMPRSTNTRFTVSSVRSGGVLKKWTIFDGGCILFLLAIAGFRNLQRYIEKLGSVDFKKSTIFRNYVYKIFHLIFNQFGIDYYNILE